MTQSIAMLLCGFPGAVIVITISSFWSSVRLPLLYSCTYVRTYVYLPKSNNAIMHYYDTYRGTMFSFYSKCYYLF